MVAAASPVHATGMASPATDGGALPFHFLSAPVTLPLDALVDRLTRLRPAALYGYPSMLARLAGEQLAGRLHLAPAFVTCTAETLTAELRATIRTGFGAPVIDSFATTEGLVGSSRPDDDAVILAEDGCIVELVDRHDRPVPPGTPSQAVLVTVLENRLQPLIRYRIDDSFVALPAEEGQAFSRVRVDGRSDPGLRFGSATLHPFALRSVLVHTPAVTDYQVRQTRRGIDVDVVAPAGVDAPGLRSRLAGVIREAGAGNAEVTVGVVSDLPRDPATGKVRRFLPLA
jgi:phenylacetate-coenzyme A ligase PaaK-like adenylate-forming protein